MSATFSCLSVTDLSHLLRIQLHIWCRPFTAYGASLFFLAPALISPRIDVPSSRVRNIAISTFFHDFYSNESFRLTFGKISLLCFPLCSRYFFVFAWTIFVLTVQYYIRLTFIKTKEYSMSDYVLTRYWIRSFIWSSVSFVPPKAAIIKHNLITLPQMYIAVWSHSLYESYCRDIPLL